MDIVTLEERPDLVAAMWDLGTVWPEFMKQDLLADVYYAEVEGRWSGHTLLAVDDGTVAARAFCVPFAMGNAIGRSELPAAGWDALIRWAHLDVLAGRVPTALGGLEVAIAPAHRGTGLAGRMIDAMRHVARRDGLDRVVLPVRPSRKHEHPHLPMAAYVARRRGDGLREDPWLRVHERIGGVIGDVCPLSMIIGGTTAQWRGWTGLPFDADGPVVVPGALAPVVVDLAADTAVYVEPNVWVEHSPARG